MAKNTTAKTKSVKPINKRKYTRFKPDPGAIALIVADEKGKNLTAPVHCLIAEESYGGAGLIAIQSPLIKKGARFKMKIGLLGPFICEVKWTKSWDSHVVSFGVEYSE